jgi:putative phosphoesterase
MKLGLISDIHAQAWALTRALDVLEREGAERVVCLGDSVRKGPDGDAVVALLRSHAIPTIQGNHDHEAVREHREDGERQLQAESVEWLAGLPLVREYTWAGVRVTLAHGSPHKVDTYVFPDDIPKPFKRAIRTLEADVLLLGHTHVPMVVRFGSLWIVNPGSVSGNRTRDSFTCATLDLPSCQARFFELTDGAELKVAPVEG